MNDNPIDLSALSDEILGNLLGYAEHTVGSLRDLADDEMFVRTLIKELSEATEANIDGEKMLLRRIARDGRLYSDAVRRYEAGERRVRAPVTDARSRATVTDTDEASGERIDAAIAMAADLADEVQWIIARHGPLTLHFDKQNAGFAWLDNGEPGVTQNGGPLGPEIDQDISVDVASWLTVEMENRGYGVEYLRVGINVDRSAGSEHS